MIVRLMGEGQWRLDDSALVQLNELDEMTEQAVADDDQAALRAALDALAAVVRAGERLADTELEPSDLVIPPVDLTVAEARDLLHGEGLIPDLP